MVFAERNVCISHRVISWNASNDVPIIVKRHYFISCVVFWRVSTESRDLETTKYYFRKRLYASVSGRRLWACVTYFSSVEDDKWQYKSHQKPAFLLKLSFRHSVAVFSYSEHSHLFLAFHCQTMNENLAKIIE